MSGLTYTTLSMPSIVPNSLRTNVAPKRGMIIRRLRHAKPGSPPQYTRSNPQWRLPY